MEIQRSLTGNPKFSLILVMPTRQGWSPCHPSAPPVPQSINYGISHHQHQPQQRRNISNSPLRNPTSNANNTLVHTYTGKYVSYARDNPHQIISYPQNKTRVADNTPQAAARILQASKKYRVTRSSAHAGTTYFQDVQNPLIHLPPIIHGMGIRVK